MRQSHEEFRGQSRAPSIAARRYRVSRRTFLHGVGVTMALPWMESLGGWGRDADEDRDSVAARHRVSSSDVSEGRMKKRTVDISGFGDGYEAACQTMLWRGVNYLAEVNPPITMWDGATEYRNVIGVLIVKGDDLKNVSWQSQPMRHGSARIQNPEKNVLTTSNPIFRCPFSEIAFLDAISVTHSS